MKDMLATAPSALYLRLPARALPRDAGASLAPLSFAIVTRGRLQRIGHASLPELGTLMQQSQRVVLLLAASDVSVFRIAVPPLPPVRLKAALPALVEDRVIGDPADCAIAVGAANGAGTSAGTSAGNQRLVAVADRAWLQGWMETLRRHGARRISALPFALCLPLPAGSVAASLVELGAQRELALRLSAHEGMGLPLSADANEQLPAEVFQLLSTFAGQRPVQLALPPSLLDEFRRAYAPLAPAGAADAARDTARDAAAIDLREENWAAWVEGAGHVTVDLASALLTDDGAAADWRPWRWPLALGAALLLLNVAALNWDWWQMRSEGAQLREAMERSFRRSFPDEALVDPVAQLRQKLAASKQAAGESAPGDFVALAASLGDVWAEAAPAMGVDARAIASMDYRDAVLTVRFKPGQQPSLDAARAALAARGLEASAVVGNAAGDAAQWQVRSTR